MMDDLPVIPLFNYSNLIIPIPMLPPAFLRPVAALCLIASFIPSPAAQAREMNREEILKEGETMAFGWLEHLNHRYQGRSWVDGVFWVGFTDMAATSDDPRWMEALQKLGNQKVKHWRVDYGPWALFHHDKENGAKEPHHADDMVIGEAFLYVYEKTKDPAVLEDIRRRVDEASTHILGKEAADKAAKAKELDWQEGLTWYWCDALFMAPPLHARLSAVTGEPKYREAMHTEWQRASDLLYDPQEHLYFRDKNFITRTSRNGHKVFWSRGNGWVIAAFARTIPYLPKDDPKRDWYVNQFREISARMASLQQPDGTWSPSLLDFEEFPYSEMSCTALTCFGMAWGINSGLLDDKTYRPVVEKAWAAMLASREGNEHRFMGYVQQVGASPARVNAGTFTWYGNGAFLMAAVQLAQMAPVQVPDIPALSAAPPREKK